ncbi:hypothetical protein I4U23_001507 [Adineta vaga]|nr:hypothetical protein I4U23_001507 [Adineta vaga]
MSKTKKSTEKQWHSVLKIDHNHRGEIISRDEYKRQSRRQHTSKSKQSHSKSPGRTKTSQSKKRKDSSVRSRSQSPDQLEIDQSQRTYKSKTSARSSSSKQSTCVPNVLLSRNVTPRIFPPGERCMITMMYFGSELKVEYDREWFEPDGEEIIVMQQHCGGENLVAFKGFLKPKDIFSFESARQTDYPFALTCFINGTMYNRLSLCCESRCKNGMRIGGRHGMFCVIDVQKERPCRRCRYEKRMKKLMEDDGKSSTSSERQLCPKSTKSSRLRSKSPAIREENSTSNTKSKKPVRSITAPTTSKSVTDSKSDAKKNDTSKESSDSFDSDSSNGKPDATRKLNTDTPAPTSNPDDSDASVQELSHVRSSSSEAFTSHNPNPEGTGAYRKNSDSSDSESANRKVAASRKLNANTPAPTSHQDDSDASVQELSQFRSSSSEAFTSHNSNPKETRTSRKNSNSSDSDSSSGKPVTSRKLNDNND